MLRILISPIIAWIIATSIKILIRYSKKKYIKVKSLKKGGGIPSGHMAAVFSLCLAIFLHEGITSLIMVTIAFSLLIFRDTYKRHTLIEMSAGALLGLIVSYLVFLF